MRAALQAFAISVSFAACACFSSYALAQDALPVTAAALPSAPAPAIAISAGSPQISKVPLPATAPIPASAVISGPSAGTAGVSSSIFQPGTSLTLHDRFILEAHTTFGPSAFAVPSAEAAWTMADPPSHYPHEWSDGAGAFGRNYGAEFARHTTGGVTHFATAAILHEDPRYFPSASTNYAARFLHSLAFTLVDRSDSGRTTLAVSNLAGSTAAGFIGMAIYPDGFNDATHAWQHAALEVSSFAAHNVVAEFSPEISRVLRKLHFSDRIADSFLPADRKTTAP